MPFTCAKAVCATFCASIAGALIPIFGPKFPLQCIPPDAPEHGRMVIDQTIVAEATREAELYRRMYANTNSVTENSQLPHHHYSHYNNHHHRQQHSQQHHYYNHGPALPSPTSIPSPRLARQALSRYGSPHDYEQDHTAAYDGFARLRSRGPDSPYDTNSEPEMSTGSGTPLSSLHHTPLSGRGGALFPPLSPPRSNGWTVVNNNTSHSTISSVGGGGNNNNIHHDQIDDSAGSYHHGSYRREREQPPTPSYSSNANPLLSAIPRFGGQRMSSSSGSSPITNTNDQSQEYGHQRLPPLSFDQTACSNTTSNYKSDRTHFTAAKNSSSGGSRSGTEWSGISLPNNNTKRPATDLLDEPVVEYDDYDNHSGSSPTTTTTTATSQDELEDDHRRPHHHDKQQQQQSLGYSHDDAAEGRSGADKSAALLLMNLSVRDERSCSRGRHGGAVDGHSSSGGGARQGRFLPRGCAPKFESMCTSPVAGAVDGHRSKRRRATSM